jgi:radical SAM superfamily enzyme YgiQ (UPF0313 family)
MRYKTDEQILEELEQLHQLGYRSIFILDDNLAGDKQRAVEILTVVRDWNESKKEPVMFSTNASVDIAEMPELASLFAQARVTNVFIGIETPNKQSLVGAQKLQNLKRDPLDNIKLLHSLGIDVAGGVMVGFDEDDFSIFQRQADFLQKTCIPICFAGMLLAPDGTELKERLIRENRYLGGESVRDHTFDTNIVPKQMTVAELRGGYFWLMNEIYEENNFLNRVRGILSRFPKPDPQMKPYRPREMRKPLKLLSVLWRLVVYYMVNGASLRRMSLRFIPLLFRYYSHAATTIYWLIAYKHFREMLIRHGVYRHELTPYKGK